MASTSMLTPSTSELRMNSCRFCEHRCPVRVSQSMAVAHSACVGSISRTKVCRCLIKACMTCRKRGSGISFQRRNATSVRFSSVTYGTTFSLCPLSLHQFLAHHAGTFHHCLHFAEGEFPRKIFQPAIRRHHDPLSRDESQCLANARRNGLRRFHIGV